MTALLDANVLVALVVAEHVHHDAAEEWFAASGDSFATCPVTQGSLARFLIREGQTADVAGGVLAAITAVDRHEFLADTVSYEEVRLDGVIGHRQVTDAYLAQLARVHGARLVTLDQGLAHLHSDVVDLLPTVPAQLNRG